MGLVCFTPLRSAGLDERGMTSAFLAKSVLVLLDISMRVSRELFQAGRAAKIIGRSLVHVGALGRVGGDAHPADGVFDVGGCSGLHGVWLN